MMRRKMVFSMIGSGIVSLALAGISEATVPRAFVSINGNDLNPCSAAQPCRSFNQALTVVQPGGEIVVQDSGGYSTGFTITQSVTIDAAGFNASVISTGPGDLCTVNAGASDRVVLRGISFHGAGIGSSAINVAKVGSLYVEHCSIAEFGVDGVRVLNGGNLFVTDTDVRKCFEGLLVGTSSTTPANLVAQDSRFTECTDAGILLATLFSSGTATGWVSNCISSLCGEGFLAKSETGANVDLTLANCRADGGNAGIQATVLSSGNATVRITGCTVTQNSFGIFTVASGTGAASVLGTAPGDNLISANASGNSVTGSASLQ
jgi:hypothetical protein